MINDDLYSQAASDVPNPTFKQLMEARISAKEGRHLHRSRKQHQTSYYRRNLVAQQTLSVRSLSDEDRQRFQTQPDYTRKNIYIRSNPTILNGRILN